METAVTPEPAPRLHSLKTIQPFYDMVKARMKPVEIRKNDRDYKPGDYLELQEFIPKGKQFTGKRVFARVTNVLQEDLKFCLKQDFCLLCLKFKENFTDEEKAELDALVEGAN